MTRNRVSEFARSEQPINWRRAFLSGVISYVFMMFFIDIFALMGVTHFSFEMYVGALLGSDPYSQQNWAIGFIANMLVGGLFGLLYGYLFEYVFFRATPRLGTRLGLGHAFVAGVVLLPFLEAIHQQLGTTAQYESLGFLGAGYGAPTIVLIIVGHLFFGMTMGLFYGPVRYDRIRARLFEPGEIGDSDDPDVITESEDPIDRQAV
jgi:hypothetical protein